MRLTLHTLLLAALDQAGSLCQGRGFISQFTAWPRTATTQKVILPTFLLNHFPMDGVEERVRDCTEAKCVWAKIPSKESGGEKKQMLTHPTMIFLYPAMRQEVLKIH